MRFLLDWRECDIWLKAEWFDNAEVLNVTMKTTIKSLDLSCVALPVAYLVVFVSVVLLTGCSSEYQPDEGTLLRELPGLRVDGGVYEPIWGDWDYDAIICSYKVTNGGGFDFGDYLEKVKTNGWHIAERSSTEHENRLTLTKLGSGADVLGIYHRIATVRIVQRHNRIYIAAIDRVDYNGKTNLNDTGYRGWMEKQLWPRLERATGR